MRLNAIALALLALLLPNYADACTKASPGSCVSQDDGVPKATPTLGDVATPGSLTMWRGAQTVLVQPSATAGNVTATLPATTGTLINTAGGQTIAGTLAVTGVLTTAASQTFITPLLTGYDVNVLALGANPNSVGTGTTDNSTYINAALAMTTPGTTTPVNAYLPAGHFHIAHTLNVGPGQCLIGAGKGATFIDVDMDFSPSATAIIELTPTTGTNTAGPCVKDLQIYMHRPADVTPTASAATAGADHFTVSSATGITTGMYVWDSTTDAAIPIGNNQPATTVTNVVGTTVTVSPVLAANVLNGDVIHFARPRTGFAALGTCVTTTAGGAPCQYPWAIHNNGERNFGISNVLIQNGWNGVYHRGPTPVIGSLEVSAFNVGFDIDGVTNFGSIDNYRFWNYDIGANTSQTDSPTALTNVIYDGTPIAANIGRLDGTVWHNLSSWIGKVNFTSAFTFAEFGDINLDGNSANLNVAACKFIQIGDLYSSKNSYTVGTSIYFNPDAGVACRATIGHGFISAGSETEKSIEVLGGDLAINGGFIIRNATVGSSPAPVVSQTGGFLTLTGVRIGASATLGTNVEFVKQTAGKLIFTNNTFENTPAADSKALDLTDNAFNRVRGNTFNNWLFTPPGPLGDYEPSYTIRYQTPGTYTYTPRVGYSKLRVRGCGQGGSGGSGGTTSTSAAMSGGAGGGSALFAERVIDYPTTAVTVVIGSASIPGAPVTAGSVTAGNNGTIGGDTTVAVGSTTMHFYPGGNGAGGQAAATSGGGGSAGLSGAGASATGATGGAAGGAGGSAGGTGVAGGTAVTFGCGGAGSGATGAGTSASFNALYLAPGCGGSGGGLTASNGANNGGTGTRGFATGVSPVGGTVGTPTGGAAVALSNDNPGNGGAGGYGSASTETAGAGGAGSYCDGGGGGGSCAYSSTCTSGAGGAGGAAFVELIPIQ